MATWKCLNCSWANAEKWTTCAKCGAQKITEADVRQLAMLRHEVSQLKARASEYRSGLFTRWQYLQMASEDIPSNGGMDALGHDGWELVATASYEEGGGLVINNLVDQATQSQAELPAD